MDNLKCECENWCSHGIPPILKHHHKCPKYSPVGEMLEIITDLVWGIQYWASDEDGVHPECWKAYSRAKICIGQFDHIKKQIESEQELTDQERAFLHHTTDGLPAPQVSPAPTQTPPGLR